MQAVILSAALPISFIRPIQPIQSGIVTMHLSRLFCIAVFLGGLTATGAQSFGQSFGQSLGRWRMPSTPAQFFGYGYGPGHHAPMIRMPDCQPMTVQRLEFASPGCQSCQPGGYSVGCVNGFFPTAGTGSTYSPAPRFYFSDVPAASEHTSPKTAEEILPTPGASQ